MIKRNGLPSFVTEKYSGVQRAVLQKPQEIEVLTQTEKAVRVAVHGETPDGEHDVTVTTWVPKSAIEKMEQARQEQEKTKSARAKQAASGGGPSAAAVSKTNERIAAAQAWADRPNPITGEPRGGKLSVKQWQSPDGSTSRTYLSYRQKEGRGYRQIDGGYIDNWTGEYHKPQKGIPFAALPGEDSKEILKMKEENIMNNLLALDSKESCRTIDSNGYLHVSMTPISKACVNPYLGNEIPGWQEAGLDGNAIYYGLRDPEELKKSAATFNGLPVLLDHHETNAESPAKEYTVGSTGTDAVFESPYLKNSLSITDAEAIKAIQDGSAREISCAYRFIPEFKSGEFEDESGEKVHYDFIMRNIAGNHVALVAEGRAGHDVAVVDSMPQKIIKRSEGSMNRKKVMAFKRRRYGMAQDANLGIEAAEILAAGFQKALNVIEAQVEGYDPKEVGLDIDDDADVAAIVEKFMPGLDEETKNLYIGVLTKLKGAEVDDSEAEPEAEIEVGTEPAADDEPVAEPEQPEEPASDDEDLDELLKDPKFKAGYEAGLKQGEQKPDIEALAADTAAKVREQVKTNFRALNQAARKVRGIVGDINDVMAFDSAEDIYAFALRVAGQDPTAYPKAAYKGMIDVLLGTKQKYVVGDTAMKGFDEKTKAAFDRLAKIQ